MRIRLDRSNFKIRASHIRGYVWLTLLQQNFFESDHFWFRLNEIVSPVNFYCNDTLTKSTWKTTANTSQLSATRNIPNFNARVESWVGSNRLVVFSEFKFLLKYQSNRIKLPRQMAIKLFFLLSHSFVGKVTFCNLSTQIPKMQSTGCIRIIPRSKISIKNSSSSRHLWDICFSKEQFSAITRQMGCH